MPPKKPKPPLAAAVPPAAGRQRLAAITVRGSAAPGACGSDEAFALRVIGDAMQPEFDDGDIIIVEPGGLLREGSFVVARCADEWTFRQLQRDGTGWALVALNPAYAPAPLADLAAVRGVVIQKTRPGRRRAIRHYVD